MNRKNPMPLYYAHFVIAKENLWLSHVEPFDVTRKEMRYHVQTQLFSATNSGAAYDRAVEMIGGLGDAHNDGPGDRTNFRCIGIYDLDEVFLGEKSLTEALNEPYGVDVGVIEFDDRSPRIRHRDDLSIFLSSAR